MAGLAVKSMNLDLDAFYLVRLFAIFLCLPSLASGQPETDVDQHSTNTEPLSTAEISPNEARTELARLGEELHRLEAEYDAYDPAIAELNLDIADRLAERGNFSDAIVAYRRALHVTRINEGLETDRQIPILERMVNTHQNLGEFELAIQHMDRLTTVYFKAYGEESPELIPHLEERGKWHLSAYHQGLGKSDLKHLVHAHNAYDQIREIREKLGLGYDPELYGSLSAVNFSLAQYYGTAEESSSELGQFSNDAPSASGFAGNSYRRGKSQLELGLSQAKESTNPGDEVQALLLLADWDQLFKKRFSAREKYLEAYQMIAGLSPEHKLYGLFNKPRRLPDFDVSSIVSTRVKTDVTPVSLTMDITAWGVSRNIQVNNDEGKDKNRAAERSAVRSAYRTIFRPMIIDGLPVSTTGVSQTLIVPI